MTIGAKNASAQIGETSFLVFRQGVGPAAVPTFVIDRRVALKYDAYDASLVDEQNHVYFDSSYYVHVFERNNTVSSPSAQGAIYLPNNFTNGQYFYINVFGSSPYGLHVHTDDYIIVPDSFGDGFNPVQMFMLAHLK